MKHMPAGLDNMPPQPLDALGVDRAITVQGYVTGYSMLLGLKRVETRRFRMGTGWWNLHVGAGETPQSVVDVAQTQGMKDLVGIGPRSVVLGRILIVGALPSESVRDCWALPAFGRYSSIIGQSIMFATPVPCSGRLGPWKVNPSLVPELDKATAKGTWKITDVSDLEWMLRHGGPRPHPVQMKALIGKRDSDSLNHQDDAANATNCHLKVSPRQIGLTNRMPRAAMGHADDAQDVVVLTPALKQTHRRPRLPRRSCRPQEDGCCEATEMPRKKQRHHPRASVDGAGCQQDSTATSTDGRPLAERKNIGSSKRTPGDTSGHDGIAQDVGGRHAAAKANTSAATSSAEEA